MMQLSSDYFLPKGEAFACRRNSFGQVGNIFEDDIKDLWAGRIEDFHDFSRFEKYSKYKLYGWCRNVLLLPMEPL